MRVFAAAAFLFCAALAGPGLAEEAAEDTRWIVDFDGAVEGAEGCRTADASNDALLAAQADVRKNPKVSWDTLRAIMRNTVRVKLIERPEDAFEAYIVVVAGMELDRPMTLSIDGAVVHRFAPGTCKDVKKGVTGCRADAKASAPILTALAGGDRLTIEYTVRGDGESSEIHAGLAALPAALSRCRAGETG
ncbi:MAG: invasion associated locus B family protein [Proteobacteria bacterium]|nr:invasion associated locus B family protein [Pseudomonadota bacterium]